MTDAERTFWKKVRDRQIGGHKFQRQWPIAEYIADFVCLEAGLIVEIDGGQHADNTEADAIRSAKLKAVGFRVLRFWNTEVLTNINGVLETMLQHLNAK